MFELHNLMFFVDAFVAAWYVEKADTNGTELGIALQRAFLPVFWTVFAVDAILWSIAFNLRMEQSCDLVGSILVGLIGYSLIALVGNVCITSQRASTTGSAMLAT